MTLQEREREQREQKEQREKEREKWTKKSQKTIARLSSYLEETFSVSRISKRFPLMTFGGESMTKKIQDFHFP